MTGRFLLDTMVVSEGFKKMPSPEAVRWLETHRAEELRVSVITFGEMMAGTEKQRFRGNEIAFDRLSTWLAETRRRFDQRTLPVTSEIAMRWGSLTIQLKRRDTDLLIAATALVHDLTVVTRNVRHFEPTGVKLFDPYQA